MSQQNATTTRPPCYCGQCGPIPLGVKPTPCNGQRMAWQRNDRGQRDPQLAVETHEEEERDYVRYLRHLIGSGALAVSLALGAVGITGCGPADVADRCKPLADVVTVAQYPDGTFSVDVYGPDGGLLTTAHLGKDAKLADVFPVGCQPDDGDEPCGPGQGQTR